MDITLRLDPTDADRRAVRDIVASTGFFHDFEIDVAVELVDERLAKGLASGYLFVFAEAGGRTVGYVCYGEIACTRGSFDIYWIAVRQDARGGGLGSRLLKEAEDLIRAAGGRKIYVETSSRPQYEPTRRFYSTRGYEIEAELKDFYAQGDSKVILVKTVG